MSDLAIRNFDDSLVQRLSAHARANRRSLEDEIKAVLERAASMFTPDEARRKSEEWHHRLAGRITDDSADPIREDRER